MTRTAIIRNANAEKVAASLPSNYHVVRMDGPDCVISGTDRMGWTLRDYVLPRLASGLYFGEEVL